MGGSNSSFLTCSGWDRYRLGWKALDNEFLISARDSFFREVDGDLDASNANDAGVYFLRDFVRSGDAIRIKIPFLPDNQFQQWLWLENHTTRKMNGSYFDRFNLEDFECTSYAEPGLYALMQVDAETKEGADIYSAVNADYLRPILANGNYDMQWSDEKVSPGFCVNGEAYHYYELLPEYENPLSGSHEQEQPLVDLRENPGQIDPNEVFPTMIKKTRDGYSRLDFMGNNLHAFRSGGNSTIGIGTNPSSASMRTYVSARKEVRNPDSRNNDEIYLNGIRVEILETFADGTLKIKIRFDDNELVSRRRWCASSIVLSDHVDEGPDLIIKGELLLDRGRTTTRFNLPDTVDGEKVFTDPTRMYVMPRATMAVDGVLRLEQDSELHFDDDAIFTMQKGSKVLLMHESRIFFNRKTVLDIQGKLKIRRGSTVYCDSQESLAAVRKTTWQKKRVKLSFGQLDVKSAP